MSDLYTLDDKNQAVKVENVIEWARQFEEMCKTDRRRVALDRLHGYRVSTVFLGVDHAFSGEDGPLIFESMIFVEEGTQTNWSGELQYRYKTWDEALEGHNYIVASIKEHHEVRKD